MSFKQDDIEIYLKCFQIRQRFLLCFVWRGTVGAILGHKWSGIEKDVIWKTNVLNQDS